MALDKKYLDPTCSGSKGAGTLAIYSAPDAKATIKGAGYFNDAANEMGSVKAILVVASDETFWAKVSIASGVVTLAALDTFA